jgi:hypothetical protein
MAEFNVVIHKKKAPGKKPLPSGTPYDDRYGFWGMVTELHPENNTVHVRTPEGRIISNVKVGSDTWVTVDKDKGYLSGRRKMPPIDTYVLCFMPNGEYSSAVVIKSGFSDDPRHGAFKEDSEDAKETEKDIENSGWQYTEDMRTGTRVLQNKPEDPTIKIEVNQEEAGKEKVTVTIHENIFTVDSENGIIVETDKDIKQTVKGNITSESSDTDIKSKAPIGLNDGLYRTGLNPYLTAETAAVNVLKTAAQNAAPQLAIVDALSGGTGMVIGLGAAIVAFCESMSTADEAAHKAIAKAVK